MGSDEILTSLCSCPGNDDGQVFAGTYSCLLVNIVIARELSFYILTIYIPCFMIVLVSWFSFWLDYKAVPARVALGVTTLLAMSTTMGSIQRSLPPVAYTKAVDVWSGVCVFFVFSALLEYALVNYASRWRYFLPSDWNKILSEISWLWQAEILQSRSDAQRASKQKEMKEKELELCAFNAEHIEDSGHTQSLVRFVWNANAVHGHSFMLGHCGVWCSCQGLLVSTVKSFPEGSQDKGWSKDNFKSKKVLKKIRLRTQTATGCSWGEKRKQAWEWTVHWTLCVCVWRHLAVWQCVDSTLWRHLASGKTKAGPRNWVLGNLTGKTKTAQECFSKQGSFIRKWSGGLIICATKNISCCQCWPF